MSSVQPVYGGWSWIPPVPSEGSSVLFVPMLGHHTASCKTDGDVVTGCSELWVLPPVRLGVKFEIGSGGSRSCPADLLVQNWVGGKCTAFDLAMSSHQAPQNNQQKISHAQRQ